MTTNASAQSIDSTQECALLQGVLADRPSAWSDFFRQYASVMHGAIHRVRRRFPLLITEDDAGEIYASLCLQLIADDKRRLRSFSPERGCRLSSWLSLLASHAAYDFLRARRRQPASPSPSDEGEAIDRVRSDGPDAYRIVFAHELTAKLNAVIESLSARDREFIHLYYLDGLTPEEAAEQLGVCVSTVYSKKHKIRARIESLMEERQAA